MGKKKGQQRVQQSMGQMVSKAALAQMGPAIERYIQQVMRQLGGQLAMQSASTLETMFSRIIVLESIVMGKLGYSKEDLANLVSNIEDEKESLKLIDGPVESGDVVRLEIKTRTKDQTEYQGSSRMKVYKTGSGETLGKELEDPILGMKAGETKTFAFGKDGEMTAEITVNRVSRSTKPVETAEANEEGTDADQSQG